MKYEFDKEEFYRISWFKLEDIPKKMVAPHLHRFLLKLGKHEFEFTLASK